MLFLSLVSFCLQSCFYYSDKYPNWNSQKEAHIHGINHSLLEVKVSFPDMDDRNMKSSQEEEIIRDLTLERIKSLFPNAKRSKTPVQIEIQYDWTGHFLWGIGKSEKLSYSWPITNKITLGLAGGWEDMQIQMIGKYQNCKVHTSGNYTEIMGPSDALTNVLGVGVVAIGVGALILLLDQGEILKVSPGFFCLDEDWPYCPRKLKDMESNYYREKTDILIEAHEDVWRNTLDGLTERLMTQCLPKNSPIE